ncbi:methyltransferase domain-containing protein [Syncephalis fuscata]|nr:methyltransferase domain-containing protein [Syncephalis fuscata]
MSYSSIQHDAAPASQPIYTLLDQNDISTRNNGASLERLAAWIARFHWLANAHVVDFFTRHHWERFELAWREALLPSKVCNETELSSDLVDSVYNSCIQLAGYWEVKDSWPESFREFVKEAKLFSLDRTPVNCLFPRVEEQLLYGVNPKKVHEIERLAWIIDELSQLHKIDQIVDLGAGQGYLSRSLTYQYGLNVLAVDADDVQTCGAQRYQKQTEKHGSKKSEPQDTKQSNRGQLVHVTHLVTEKSLAELLKAIQTNIYGVTASDQPTDTNLDSLSWLLCGLHTCGDLGPSSLRLFTESDANILVNVGCCYNLLTEEEEEDTASNQINEPSVRNKENGFPMSRQIQLAMPQAANNRFIGLTGRHLACQAPSRWPFQLSATKTAFERNYYRALLHLFMVEHHMADPNLDAPQVGRFGRSPIDTFESYALIALKRLLTRRLSLQTPLFTGRVYRFLTQGLLPELSTDDSNISNTMEFTQPDVVHDACLVILRDFEQRHALGRLQVAIFWTLRVLLAPALERLILEDRVAYLRERGHAAWLVALFDPIASPRNLAIISTKKQQYDSI